MRLRYKIAFGPLFMALMLAAGACERGRENASEESPRPVRTEKVRAVLRKQASSLPGVVVPGKQSNLSFRVGGRVSGVDVEMGDRLGTGDPVARLDSTDFSIAVRQAEAALGKAESRAGSASATYERIRRLYESRHASRNELDQARAAAEAAEATVRALEQKLRLARRKLSYTRLESPGDCSVIRVLVEEDENVGAGMPVAALECGDHDEVRVSVPETLIGTIQTGDTATVDFDALPGSGAAGRVTEAGPASVGMETTFPVTVRMNENLPEVLPGMSARVTFAPDETTRHVLVPAHAVGEDRRGRHVFVAVPDDGGETATIRRKSVKTGELTSRGIRILDGLKPGDLLVVAGMSRMEDGRRVRLGGGEAFR
ncbi:MAG: efflux RND transporter periplasmic adaptor subunit [Desulfatibacillaceae bacterium]